MQCAVDLIDAGDVGPGQLHGAEQTGFERTDEILKLHIDQTRERLSLDCTMISIVGKKLVGNNDILEVRVDESQYWPATKVDKRQHKSERIKRDMSNEDEDD